MIALQSRFNKRQIPAKQQKQFGFAGLKSSGQYNNIYKSLSSNSWFGSMPDQKILQTIGNYFPESDKTSIVDVGAGKGRNTFSLAQKGYSVLALESSEVARQYINEFSYLPENIITSSLNITKKPTKQKHNAFIMSHVTQHFNIKELEMALENISKSTMQGGILIFDALIDKKSKIKANIRRDEIRGFCHFPENDLLNLTKKNGFELLEQAPYTEKGSSRPFYIDQKKWGGKGINYGRILGDDIKIKGGMKHLFSLLIGTLNLAQKLSPRKDVSLKWFTLKKI